MQDFFIGCINVEHVKATFRQLAKEFHPDLGGRKEDMQELNRQYHQALSKLHGAKSIREGKEFTYYYNEGMETELADMVYRLLGLKMADVDVALIGLWIWVQGDTRPYKESLKGLGCRWHAKRTAWYFHSSRLRTRFNPNISLDGLAAVYGYQKIEGEGMKHFD